MAAKSLLCVVFVTGVFWGCSDDPESPAGPEETSLFGTWDIKSLAMNDTAMNFNDMYDILRKVTINPDGTGELHWYDKLVLDGVELCMWTRTEDKIVFTVSIPNETWSYEFDYVFGQTLTLSQLRDTKTWVYTYTK